MSFGRDDAPIRLRDLLAGASSRVGVEQPVETGRIWARWSAIVGEGIAEHAEPISLREGTLKIRASSPTWATELTYLVEQIKSAVNADVGRPLVSQVVVSTGQSGSKTKGFRRSETPHQETTERAPEGPPPADAAEALTRAHEAWLKRHSRRS
jgi:predicted nucleic acid-binding Zn ribbon protein